MLRDIVGKNFYHKLVHREIEHAAILHTRCCSHKFDRNLDLELLASMNYNKIDVGNAVGHRMELHFAQNCAGGLPIQVQADGVSFVGVNERTEIQLFYMESYRWLAVTVKNPRDAAFIA